MLCYCLLIDIVQLFYPDLYAYMVVFLFLFYL